MQGREQVLRHIGVAKDDELLLAGVLFDAPAGPDPLLGRLGQQRLLQLPVARLQLVPAAGAMRSQPGDGELVLGREGLVKTRAGARGVHVEEGEAATGVVGGGLGGCGGGISAVGSAAGDVWRVGDGAVGEEGGKPAEDGLVLQGVDPGLVRLRGLPGGGDGEAVRRVRLVDVGAADGGRLGAVVGVVGADPVVLDLFALHDELEELDGVVAVAEGEEGEFGDGHGVYAVGVCANARDGGRAVGVLVMRACI